MFFVVFLGKMFANISSYFRKESWTPCMGASIEKVHDHIRNFPFLVPYCTENASNLYLLHCHAAGTIGMYLYNVLYNVHVLYIQYKGSRSFLLRKPHLEHKESKVCKPILFRAGYARI